MKKYVSLVLCLLLAALLFTGCAGGNGGSSGGGKTSDAAVNEALLGCFGKSADEAVKALGLKDDQKAGDYGYTLDYAALLEGQVRPENYYYMLGRRPERDIPAVRELPAGTYLCYRCRILSPGADLTPLLEILEKLQGEHMVIANESDDNLDDALGAYVQSQFELQVFLYP